MEHQASVRWQISRLVFDSQTVDDLAQEVFVVWFQRTNQDERQSCGEAVESVRGWLLRVARNKAIDWLRKNSRQPAPTGNLNELVDSLSAGTVASENSVGAGAEGETRLQALRHCLGLLQPEHREIVQEFYGQGKSSELIGVRLGKGSSGVRMMLTRIRRALGKCIRRQLEKKS